MRLLSLHLRNFRQHADTAVDFPETGILGIVGANESGKSALLEGVTWALFGSRATRGTKAGLRWNRAPARHVAAATLRFEVGGRLYQVERTEADARILQLGEAAAAIAEGTSAVDAHVPQLLGMSLDEFAASYMCRQKDLGRLAAMGPTERQTFVRGVLGLDRIDAALKACRARRNDLERERDGLAAGLGERGPLQEARDDAERRLSDARASAESLQAELTGADSAAEAAAAEQSVADRAAERARYLQENLRHAEAERSRESAELARIRGELQEAADSAARVEAASEDLARLPRLREERDRLNEQRSKVWLLEKVRQTIGAAKMDVTAKADLVAAAEERVVAYDRSEHGELIEQVAAAEVELTAGRQARVDARAATLAEATVAEGVAKRAARRLELLRSAGADGTCPTCARPLGAKLEEVIADLEAERDAASRKVAGLREAAQALLRPGDDEAALLARVDRLKRSLEAVEALRHEAELARHKIDQLQRGIEERKRELQDLRAELARIGETHFDPQRLEEVEREIRVIEQMDELLAGDRGRAAQIDALQGRAAERKAAIEAARETAALAREQLEALAYDAEAHQRLCSAAAEAKVRLDRIRTESALADANVHHATAALEQAEASLGMYDDRAEKLAELDAELRTHARAADRLNEFRLAQVSKIRPELEELTSGFVGLLTDGRHDAVIVSEEFEATLYEAGVPVEVVSGGTEDVAALALRLALSQMIAQRAGHPLSLLVLDEPFGSLDEIRRGNVLNLIRRLRSTFQQVIVISHVAETRDAVDYVIELEHDEAAGRSRVIAQPVGAGAPSAEEVPA